METFNYQLQPGTKIRCINSKGATFLTQNKIYEVIVTPCYYCISPFEFVFWFIDDTGDPMYSSPSHEEFEVVE